MTALVEETQEWITGRSLLLSDRLTGGRVDARRYRESARAHAIDHEPGSTRGATRHTVGSADYAPPRGSNSTTVESGLEGLEGDRGRYKGEGGVSTT